MAETSTIFGFMKYVSATDILSDFKKTVDSYFVNSLKEKSKSISLFYLQRTVTLFFASKVHVNKVKGYSEEVISSTLSGVKDSTTAT